MTVYRIKHEARYVVLDKEIFENSKISLRSKGLWAFCMSKPDNWEFHLNQLESSLMEGRTALLNSINELITWGYIVRIQKKDSYGRYCTYDYEIYEKSQLKKSLPETCFPLAVEPLAVNQPLLSIDLNQVKKEEIKKNVPSATASGLASDLLSAILKTKPDAKKPKLENWAIEIDRMINIDCVTPERIKRMIDHLPTLDFWKTNILSADKLRKQVDMIELAIQTLGDKKEKQQQAIQREQNKAWVMQMIAKYPEGLKNVKFSGWMVQNPQNSKDVSLNMLPERFQEVFASVFGGEKDEL